MAFHARRQDFRPNVTLHGAATPDVNARRRHSRQSPIIPANRILVFFSFFFSFFSSFFSLFLRVVVSGWPARGLSARAASCRVRPLLFSLALSAKMTGLKCHLAADGAVVAWVGAAPRRRWLAGDIVIFTASCVWKRGGCLSPRGRPDCLPSPLLCDATARGSCFLHVHFSWLRFLLCVSARNNKNKTKQRGIRRSLPVNGVCVVSCPRRTHARRLGGVHTHTRTPWVQSGRQGRAARGVPVESLMVPALCSGARPNGPSRHWTRRVTMHKYLVVTPSKVFGPPQFLHASVRCFHGPFVLLSTTSPTGAPPGTKCDPAGSKADLEKGLQTAAPSWSLRHGDVRRCAPVAAGTAMDPGASRGLPFACLSRPKVPSALYLVADTRERCAATLYTWSLRYGAA